MGSPTPLYYPLAIFSRKIYGRPRGIAQVPMTVGAGFEACFRLTTIMKSELQ